MKHELAKRYNEKYNYGSRIKGESDSVILTSINKGILEDAAGWRLFLHRRNTILSFIPNENRLSILDVGCGDGIVLAPIANRHDIFGLDISEDALKEARLRGYSSVKQCNIEEPPWPVLNEKYDIIVVTEVIEHIVDTGLFCSEIRKYLKPGGTLIITTPNGASLGARLRLLRGLPIPYFDPSLEDGNAHLRIFTRLDLEKIFRRYNFSLITLITTPFLLPKLWRKFSWAILRKSPWPLINMGVIIVGVWKRD